MKTPAVKRKPSTITIEENKISKYFYKDTDYLANESAQTATSSSTEIETVPSQSDSSSTNSASTKSASTETDPSQSDSASTTNFKC